eukprot:5543125-Ditylum_brightwellii.AAC.1
MMYKLNKWDSKCVFVTLTRDNVGEEGERSNIVASNFTVKQNLQTVQSSKIGEGEGSDIAASSFVTELDLQVVYVNKIGERDDSDIGTRRNLGNGENVVLSDKGEGEGNG